MRVHKTVSIGLALAVAACGRAPVPTTGDADAAGASAPTAATVAANRAVAESLPLADAQDFEDARRGFVASVPGLKVQKSDGRPVWDLGAYEFINDAPAPDSVNPSLWRQAQLNNIHGLFKVADGIWQVRGYDISNMSLIEGERGWIVVDPLTAQETAAAAMALVREHLGDRPVSAFVFSHSHIDHFGGVFGVVSAEQARNRDLRVIAPSGFIEEATSENVLAGTTMLRRAGYMYGSNLPRTPRGHVDTGLGKAPAHGTVGILPPTDLITETGQQLTVDGVEMVFQNAPASEAPAELTFYLPQKKAFFGAEVVSRNMHNLYTLRGTKVRDALRWSGYIDQALTLFGEAEIYFAAHQWPLWGRERIHAFMKQQRDVYKYLHDQTLRLAGKGLTPGEIAEELRMPAALAKSFSSRGYYGTVKHNARAVYQHYFGWYDANPAHLDPLPRSVAAVRYVNAIGGPAALLAQAQQAFEAGDYRWSAELLNHLVFAEPDHRTARGLLAQCYDQLGYQAESGPWRDVYLSAAHELRHGLPAFTYDLADTLDLLRHTPIPRFFDAMAGRLNGPDAENVNLVINIVFTDRGEEYALDIENAVLHHRPGRRADAHATLSLTHELFLAMMVGKAGLKDTLFSDSLRVEGSRLDLVKFFSLLDKPDTAFNIVTP
jgi:alkyl sulfatase BDS1-like metallo-beta-lactamase superfamily hydrolase